MLQFGMETKRINDIVNKGAASRLDDVQFIRKELERWLMSPERIDQITGENYYKYEQAILAKKRMVIDGNDSMKEDVNLPNHKIIDNQYAKMVDQKVNYILSKPLTFQCDNEAYIEALNKIFNKKFHRLLKNVGKDSYNGAIGYLYPYYDEQGEFKFKRFRPWEVKVFWKDDDKTEIEFFWHYYQIAGYKGDIYHIFNYLDVYDTQGIHKFEYEDGALIPDYSTYYFELDTDEEIIPYNWTKIPLIAFKSNSACLPLIKKCKSLQDAINQILSEFNDGMEENASGNSIIVIHNYDGTDLGQFRRNLSAYKAVKVRTVDGADGGIDKLEITVNVENYKAVLAELKKALIQNCKGYDVEELKSSGSPNEMTIKAVYSDIDLDANELETEYQASFEDLLWFINQYLANSGKGNFEAEEVDVIFNRDMMVNESQVITDINNSSSLLSKRTLIANHPWISNVDKELEQLQEDQDSMMEQFGNAFVEQDVGGESEDEESELLGK